ncbi:D-lactaldehyde dehydrogenase [Crucibulum laeve]|uniref:D-lactaldehyde dehydrogenase n=1 Tax=Crucibulum laeve TaxID=68775 RepID=A0A5C3M0Z6_9AGAR|nr:D-lactaldehyde dehydrogenase [Crucibulum laeve]
MPVILPSTESKVLVTGANGYIAAWVVQGLLQQGYSVRGTVRNEEKGKHLRELCKSFGERFEIVTVEDITKEGAFDDAVKGVDAVEHMASPITEIEDPEEYIKPAVNGTLSILTSILKHGSKIKRVVYTSSCGAITSPNPPEPATYSEKDWNTTSIKVVEEQGRQATPHHKYRASKTLAERAAWEFYEKHKAEVEWDLVVINPPMVYGPFIHAVTTPLNLNASLQIFYAHVFSPTYSPKSEEALKASTSWVDVRDVADAHIMALQKEKASGHRFIISCDCYDWQEWIDLANSLALPTLSSPLPKGIPGLERLYMIKYDTTQAKEILGITKYRSKEESLVDMANDFARRRW